MQANRKNVVPEVTENVGCYHPGLEGQREGANTGFWEKTVLREER